VALPVGMGDTTPLEALGGMWGERDATRRTHGAPKRTQFLAALAAIASDARQLDREQRNGTAFCAMPELERYAAMLTNAWAGEGGWDTDKLITGVQAASAQTHVTNEAEAPRDD
jgi:hypothetical protein